MSPRKSGVKVLLTDRALRDLADIEAFSVERWGKRTAAKYITQIDAALQRLREKPSLARPLDEFHPAFCFFQVNQHVLVCDVHPNVLVVVTVIHGSRDIPTRLAEISPNLAAEVDFLHKKLKRSR